MNIIFRTTLIIFFVLTVNVLFSQNQNEKTVSITVSGSGKTQDEAKQSALRSAIEQAFGAFISAKTEILNDQIISDQISSVASGNIQSYDLLNASQLPDGSWGITLKALVSIDKLTSFVEAKGIAIEIKGGLFALNIKQQLLNEQSEIRAICDMVSILHENMQTSFDYDIKTLEPQSVDSESKNWKIPVTITVTANKNMDFCADYCTKTLSSVCLSEDEIANYKNLNKEVFSIKVYYNNICKEFYLRKEISIQLLESLKNNWFGYLKHFKIQLGLNDLNNSKKYIDFNYNFFDKKCEQIIHLSNNSAYTQLTFPTSGLKVNTFNWFDYHTLSEIEKITGYNVKPKGVTSFFKHGGYVIKEENGHGIVLSPINLGYEMSWEEAITKSNEFELCGYNDWYLPNIEELFLAKNLFSFDFGNIENMIPNDRKYFWSSTVLNTREAWYHSFNTNIGDKDYDYKYEKKNVRAFRAF